MNRLRIAAALLAPGLLAGAAASPADYWADPANPWVVERLRIERQERQWADLVVLPSRNAWSQGGPRTWNPQDQNPWANTFGTPAEGRARVTPLRPRGAPVLRLCSCYLPSDARSWDGGPLTDADIARLCRAQCY